MKMNFIKRLMEIKEQQLDLEFRRVGYMMNMDETITQILKQLKGGKQKHGRK